MFVCAPTAATLSGVTPWISNESLSPFPTVLKPLALFVLAAFGSKISFA